MNAMIENPHPLIIHFPIALLLLGSAADIAGLLLRREELFRAGWYAMIVGAPAAIVTGVTGLWSALHAGYMAPDVEEAVNLHGLLVAGSIVLFTLLFIVRYPCRPVLPAARALYVAAMVVAALLLGIGAHFGGELVYVHHVGLK